jgi:hypothetical protein
LAEDDHAWIGNGSIPVWNESRLSAPTSGPAAWSTARGG